MRGYSFHSNETIGLDFILIWANSLIMRTEQYHLDVLKHFFQKQKIATREQITRVLGDPARCTVFRKLGQLQYLSSYSHRGKYYTLKTVARFNSQGIWSFKHVWFSCFGNLLDTCEQFVQRSETGYSAVELREILHVKTKHALNQLVRDDRLQRKKVQREYIYLTKDERTARQQLKARKIMTEKSSVSLVVTNADLAVEEAKTAIILFCSLLDEKQRRIYAGLESLKLGHGGDKHIAALLGMDPHTVAQGRQQIMQGDVQDDFIRISGGGCIATEKKRHKS